MKKLFGTFGVRRLANEVLTPEFASKLAAAYGSTVEGKIAVGGDTRTSTVMIKNAVISGLLSSGCDVVDLGILPTPAVQYAVRKYYDGGVIVTASHNPPQYNGIKFVDSDGIGIPDDLEEEIERIFFSEDFRRASWDKIGNLTSNSSIIREYQDGVIARVDAEAIRRRKFRVVVDCGCGAASYTMPYILRRLGCQVIALNSQPDGFFPGRDPEPVPENLSELMETVRSTGADLGIAHDGDADRMVAIDDQGRFASFDKLLALMAREIGGKIITTVDASLCVDECLGDRGEVIRTRVGDVHVANTIAEEGARFGGEPSGTWLHPDFCMCPDGILSALRVAELVSARGPLSELLEEVPSYPNIRDKVPCPDEKKDIIMERVAAELSGKFSETSDINTIDGVRISLDDGSWVLVRPSGTEPYIRITLEGKTEEKARYIHERTRDYLENVIG